MTQPEWNCPLQAKQSEPFRKFALDEFKAEFPTGSGTYLTLYKVAKEIVRILFSISQRDAGGRGPVYEGNK